MKYKYLPILFSVAVSLQAANYSYIVASSPSLSDLKKNLIVKKFSNGYIEKQDKYYVYKVGPFASYQAAKESKREVKNAYPTAFIVKNTLSESAIISEEKKSSISVQEENSTQSNTEIPQEVTIPENKELNASEAPVVSSNEQNSSAVQTKGQGSIWDDVKTTEKANTQTAPSANIDSYSYIVESAKELNVLEKKIKTKQFPNGYIEKQEKYFVYKVGPYVSYQEAKSSKSNVKKIFPGAFIVKNRLTSTSLVKSSMNQSTTATTASVNTDSKVKNPEMDSSTNSLNKKQGELKPLAVSDVSKYDNLYLQTYLNELFENNENAKEIFFQQKIDYLLADIQKDKYNFDVYLSGAVSTGEVVNFATQSPSTLATATINVNKRVYDGGYSLSEKYEAINKRLAEVTSINTKDRLALLGTALYYDLYNSQERVVMYKALIEEQKNFKDTIQVKYKNGTSSVLDYIDAKNDFIALQRTLSDANYQFLHNEYVLRQSIHSKSSLPLKLFAANVSIDINLNETTNIQERAIANSSDIAMESSLVKLKTADLINEQKRYYPTVDFTSNAGFANQNPKVFNFASNGAVGIWNLGLSVNIPLYNRGDIRLNIQKSQYAAMLEENKFSSKIRDVLNETQRSQTQLLRLNEQKKYVSELLSLAKKKLETSKERYLKGLAQYRDYSEALNRVLGYQNDMITIESDIIKESFVLSIIVGKREFYEQN